MPKKPNSFVPDNLISVAEAARRLSCSERQIWRLIAERRLKVVRIGRLTRVIEQSLQDLIDHHSSQGARSLDQARSSQNLVIAE